MRKNSNSQERGSYDCLQYDSQESTMSQTILEQDERDMGTDREHDSGRNPHAETFKAETFKAETIRRHMSSDKQMVEERGRKEATTCATLANHSVMFTWSVERLPRGTVVSPKLS
jgi:hypothetical protein